LEQGARMQEAGSERRRLLAGSEVDRWQRVAHLSGAAPSSLGIAEAELTTIVTPPAFGLSIGEQRTAVAPSDGERQRRLAGAQAQERKVIAHLAGLAATVFLVAEAELALLAAPPAFDASAGEQRACMEPPEGQRAHALAAEVHRREKIAELLRL